MCLSTWILPTLNTHTHRSQTFLIHPMLRRAESCRRPGESPILVECPTSPWHQATIVQKMYGTLHSYQLSLAPCQKHFTSFLPSPFIFQGLQTILSPFKFFSILQILLDMYNSITYYLTFTTSSWCLFTPTQFLSGFMFEKTVFHILSVIWTGMKTSWGHIRLIYWSMGCT